MNVKLELQGIDFGISGPGGQEVTVRFIVRSDFGEVKLGSTERLQQDEKLEDTVNRARAKIVQFAEALQQQAAAPLPPGAPART